MTNAERKPKYTIGVKLEKQTTTNPIANAIDVDTTGVISDRRHLFIACFWS